MSGQNQNAKDAQRAQLMKRLGIERTSARCPICHRVVAKRGLRKHIEGHQFRGGHNAPKDNKS